MASKAVIKVSTIRKYFGKYFENCLERAENALESGHLKSFTYDPDGQVVKASILPSKNSGCYEIVATLDGNEISSTRCQCTRSLAYCSHVCAALLHLSRNVSVTDGPCSWATRKTRTKDNAKPIASNNFKAIEIQAMPTSEEVKQYLTEKCKHCHGAAVSVLWLASGERSRPSDPADEIIVVNPYEVVSSEAYRQAACKKAFLADILGVDWDIIQEVADLTKGQGTSPFWFTCRKGRLTASMFGEILKIYSRDRAPPKPSQSLLQKLYEPPNLENVMSAMWGRDHEPVAIEEFTKKYKTVIIKTGFWLDECGYLGGGPDGLIGTRGTIEVKGPYSLRTCDLNLVLKPDCDYFLYFENGTWQYDTDHIYYHQVQAQLYFTRRDYCVFVAWTLKSLVVKRVNKDPLWAQVCIPLLQDFYVGEFVPYVQRKESHTS